MTAAERVSARAHHAQDVSLFGLDLALGFDSPRAGKDDPISSHMAADRSQETLALTRDRVVLLVRQEGEITGRDLNDLYRARADREGWARISYDSPRKRAAELLADGVLACTNEDAARGIGRIYCLGPNS